MIKTTLQSVLDNWIAESCCPHCDACGEVSVMTITARNGNVFEDMVELNILHNPDCPYAQIAALLGKDGRQVWRDEDRIARGDIVLGESEG